MGIATSKAGPAPTSFWSPLPKLLAAVAVLAAHDLCNIRAH